MASVVRGRADAGSAKCALNATASNPSEQDGRRFRQGTRKPNLKEELATLFIRRHTSLWIAIATESRALSGEHDYELHR
jgi:hypothetical protein